MRLLSFGVNFRIHLGMLPRHLWVIDTHVCLDEMSVWKAPTMCGGSVRIEVIREEYLAASAMEAEVETAAAREEGNRVHGEAADEGESP